MNKSIFFAFLVAALPAGLVQAAPFPKGNADIGKEIVARVGCNGCHARLVGGDGTAIFTRADRIVTSSKQLVARIDYCSGNIGANLSATEKEHIAAYLNRQYYRFK
ncbi:MAG: cytochrome c [Pseudomonadota bacterium]